MHKAASVDATKAAPSNGAAIGLRLNIELRPGIKRAINKNVYEIDMHTRVLLRGIEKGNANPLSLQ